MNSEMIKKTKGALHFALCYVVCLAHFCFLINKMTPLRNRFCAEDCSLYYSDFLGRSYYEWDSLPLSSD